VRTLAAAVLAFQSVVIALAIPVAIAVAGVPGAQAGWAGGGLAVLCLVTAGLTRYRWSYAIGWGIQAACVAAGFVVPVMFVLGAAFTALWWAALHYGAKGDQAQARFRAEAPDAEASGETGDDPPSEPAR
jgi:hypothetical protein